MSGLPNPPNTEWPDLLNKILSNPSSWPTLLLGAQLWMIYQFQQQQATFLGALLQRLDALAVSMNALEKAIK